MTVGDSGNGRCCDGVDMVNCPVLKHGTRSLIYL